MKFSIASIILLAVFAASNTQAQELWSLTKCIDYAKKQSISVQRSNNDMRTAEVQANTAKNSRLPNVSASLNQNMAFGFTKGINNTYGNQNSASTDFGINAGVNIFKGNYINSQIKYTDWTLKAAVEDINQIAEDISIKVTLAYLQVLYNKELVRVASENVAQSKSQLLKTEKLVEGERSPKSELFENKAQLAKDEYGLTKAQSDLKLALLELAQLMELTSIENFDIEMPNVDQIAINSDAVLSLSESNIENAFNRRPAVKAAELRLQAGEQNIKMMKSAYYPTLNFIASYGNNYYYAFDQPAGVNASFATQLKNQSQKLVGLQLNIPIFNRFETRNSVSLARIEMDQRKLNLVDAKKTLFKELQQAYYNAMSAQQNFVSAQKALEASNIAYKYAQDKYDAGRSTVFEINEVKKRLATSQSELAQARYEYIFRTKLLDYYHGTPISL